MGIEQQKTEQKRAVKRTAAKGVAQGAIRLQQKRPASPASGRAVVKKSAGQTTARAAAKPVPPTAARPGQRQRPAAELKRQQAASPVTEKKQVLSRVPVAKVPAQPPVKNQSPAGKGNSAAGMFMRIAPRNRDLITDIRATILVQSPQGGRWIIWLTLAFVIAFFIWAAFSELEEVTRSNGKVVPSSQIQVVQNLEGGILSELNIRVGDVVERDQVLLKIDKTRFTASYNESRASFLALTAKVARLEAEVQGKKFIVPQVVEKENPRIGSREAQLYKSRMRALENSKQILKEQLAQRRQELTELQGKLRELNRTNEILKKEIGITRPLVSQGAVSEIDILRLERQSSEMRGSIQAIELSIPKIRSQIKEAKKAIEDEKLKYINLAREELNKAYTDLESISASSVALADRLQRTEVRSPVKGTVNRILVNTVGGIIQPGMDLIEIVPLEDSLLIEARIKPSDIAFLRPDQKAMVKFSAYDFTIYGGLEAKLEQISADSLTDERGDDYYLVRLRTKKNYLGSEDEPLPIIPGMIVTVDIISGKKTVLSYLLKPMLRAKYLALRER